MTLPDDPNGLVPEATDAEALASALLDGEATPAEQARAGEPDVVRARASFERVAQAIASPVEVDELVRSRAIAAALAAADPTAAAPPVDELARRRAARRGLKVAGIAAAIVGAVTLTGIAIVNSDSADDDSSSDVATEAATADDGADRSAAEDSAGTGGAASGSSNLTLAFADLGAYDDLDALVEAAADAPDTTPPTTVASQSDESAGDATSSAPAPVPAADADGAPACTPPTPPVGDTLTTYTATLEGRPVVVVVADGPDGQVVQVYDASTCEVAFDGQP